MESLEKQDEESRSHFGDRNSMSNQKMPQVDLSRFRINKKTSEDIQGNFESKN